MPKQHTSARSGDIGPTSETDVHAPSRVAVIQTALVTIAVLAATWWLMRKGLTTYKYTDLRVYYGAMQWWFNDDQPLYDFSTYLFRYELGFTYPPFAALVMSPFAFIGLATAYVVFTEIAVVAFGIAIWWLIRPLVRRNKWPSLTAFGLAFAALFVMEPVWVTVVIGQINWLIIILVLGDAIFLLSRGSRWAGVGIGLAIAIKLTPGIFLLYLLLTKRFRAALMAVATAVAASALAAAVAPKESWVFWTKALWDTERVGVYSRNDNQSLMGSIARVLHTNDPNKTLWLAIVAIVIVFTCWRAYKAFRAGDEIAGITFFGLLSGLVSPVSWIHHLFWVVPVVVICVDVGLRLRSTSRATSWYYLGAAFAFWAIFASVAVWTLAPKGGAIGWFGENAYVLSMLAMLVVMPYRHSGPVNPPEPVPAKAEEPALTTS